MSNTKPKQGKVVRLAIIPARGGSKRIPGKNIKPFLGRPIIEYPIKAALESQLFDEVMVSTDDEKIANIAKKAGATVPFMRSAENANDNATTADVLLEVLRNYIQRGESFEQFVCLYPTAVFISSLRLKEAIALMEEKQYTTVLSLQAYAHPIWRAYKQDKGNYKPLWEENMQKRTQDLEPCYYDAGQFYLLQSEAFLQSGTIQTKHTGGIILKDDEAADIDTPEDWARAEYLYQYKKR